MTLLPQSIFTVRLTSINLAIHPNENSVPATTKLQERKVGEERTQKLNSPTRSAFSGKGSWLADKSQRTRSMSVVCIQDGPRSFSKSWLLPRIVH